MRASPHLLFALLTALCTVAGVSAAPAQSGDFQIFRQIAREKGRRPKGTEPLKFEYIGRKEGKVLRQTIYVDPTLAITREDIQTPVTISDERLAVGVVGDPKGASWWSSTDATVRDLRGDSLLEMPALRVRFTAAGRRKFAELRDGWVGKNLVVVVNGRVIATPLVRETTDRGEITIVGMFDKGESKAMAAELNGKPSAIGEAPKPSVPRLYPVAPSGSATGR